MRAGVLELACREVGELLSSKIRTFATPVHPLERRLQRILLISFCLGLNMPRLRCLVQVPAWDY